MSSTKARKRLIELFSQPRNGYSDEAQALKTEAHFLARKVLREFATQILGLSKDQFTVRTNEGGVAVTGETILHTDPIRPDAEGGLYLQITEPLVGGCGIMYRRCKDRKDYTGATNHWITVAAALGNDNAEREFGETLKSLVIPLQI